MNIYYYLNTKFKSSGINIMVLYNEFVYYFCYVKFERPSADNTIFYFIICLYY